MTGVAGPGCIPACGSRVAGVLLAALLALSAGCGVLEERDGPPGDDRDLSRLPDAVPKPEPPSRYGNPPEYEVNGQRYYTLDSSRGYREQGFASWYGQKFHGRRTSSGEIYDMYQMTAAHRTLPLPTYVRVVNLENGLQTVVRVNDRGPFHPNRIIDLSYAAATKLDVVRNGTARVEVAAIDPGASVGAAEPGVSPPSASPQPQAQAQAGNLLFLQVGAFAERPNAVRLKEWLEQTTGMLVELSEVAAEGRVLHRVRLGPLAGIETADRLADVLLRAGIRDFRLVLD